MVWRLGGRGLVLVDRPCTPAWWCTCLLDGLHCSVALGVCSVLASDAVTVCDRIDGGWRSSLGDVGLPGCGGIPLLYVRRRSSGNDAAGSMGGKRFVFSGFGHSFYDRVTCPSRRMAKVEDVRRGHVRMGCGARSPYSFAACLRREHQHLNVGRTRVECFGDGVSDAFRTQ